MQKCDMVVLYSSSSLLQEIESNPQIKLEFYSYESIQNGDVLKFCKVEQLHNLLQISVGLHTCTIRYSNSCYCIDKLFSLNWRLNLT